MEKTVHLDDHDSVYDGVNIGEPILRTKLHRPHVAADIVPRPRLVELLEADRHRPLTVISAAAGYGKSTLASQWLETSAWPGGWVSLDERDNDPRLFLTYLLVAMENLFPGLSLKTQSLLKAPDLPPVPVLARYVLNDLDRVEEPFILVLDDYHCITEEAVHQLLGELLQHPSPVLHLALLSRRSPPLPLAALRGRGQVTQIGLEQLYFTAEETSAFLEQALGMPVDEEIAAKVERSVEGWVTGLRLIALSVGQDKDAGHILKGLEGVPHVVKQYLVQEVLSQSPPGLLRYLLETSILDRFCAPLCEALHAPGVESDEADGMSGQAFIEWLEESHLFMIPLDHTHHWFRYHHWFQQLLRAQLKRERSPGDIARLHSLASRWFAENELIEEALQHALAAEDGSYAVHLVEQRRYSLMNTQQWHRLQRWLQLLPADVVAQSPHLTSTKAFTRLFVHSGQDRQIVTAAQQAENLPTSSKYLWPVHLDVMVAASQQAKRLLAALPPESEESTAIRGEITAIQGAVDLIQGQPTQAIASARRSLQMLPSQAHFVRSVMNGSIGLALQMQGEFRQGDEVIREALADSTSPAIVRANLMHYLCLVHFMEGDLSGVVTSGRDFLRISEEAKLPWSISHARYHLGVAHYLRNESGQAEPYLRALLEDRYMSAPSYLAHGGFALALNYHAQGRMAEAAQVIELVSAHFWEMKDTVAYAHAQAFRVQLVLQQGKLAEARRLSKSVEFDLRPPLWYFYVPQITPIKLLVAEGTRGGLEKARLQLDDLDEHARKLNLNNVRPDVLALQALVYDALDEKSAAFEKLRAALALGEPGEFMRTFVDLGTPMANLLLRLIQQEAGIKHTDYVHRILAAFPDEVRAGRSTASVPDRSGHEPTDMSSIDPLTRRELQILKLLTTDLSRQEIAARLVISPGTVHTHTKNIYSKLHVNNRIQAVNRARELGLI